MEANQDNYKTNITFHKNMSKKHLQNIIAKQCQKLIHISRGELPKTISGKILTEVNVHGYVNTSDKYQYYTNGIHLGRENLEEKHSCSR